MLQRTLSLILVVLLVACGRPGERQSASAPSLSAKAALYRSLVVPEFLSGDHCDSLLWSGLAASAGIAIPIQDAEASPGRWLRRPIALGPCTPEAGTSRSSISRDMLLGVYWYAWRARDLGMAERLWDYAVDHAGIMGTGEGKEHTVLNAATWRLLAEIIQGLGGKRHPVQLAFPVSPPNDAEGFVAHLGAVQLALLGEITGHLSASQIGWLSLQALRQPKNPLFTGLWHLYTDGNIDDAVDLLMNSPAWPSDRLPTSADRCEFWPLSRDDGADWQPCPKEGKMHSGAELVWLASVLQQ